MLDHAGEVASSACHCGHDDERGFKVLHAALTLAERVSAERGEIDVGLYLKLCERLPRPPRDPLDSRGEAFEARVELQAADGDELELGVALESPQHGLGRLLEVPTMGEAPAEVCDCDGLGAAARRRALGAPGVSREADHLIVHDVRQDFDRARREGGGVCGAASWTRVAPLPRSSIVLR